MSFRRRCWLHAFRRGSHPRSLGTRSFSGLTDRCVETSRTGLEGEGISWEVPPCLRTIEPPWLSPALPGPPAICCHDWEVARSRHWRMGASWGHLRVGRGRVVTGGAPQRGGWRGGMTNRAIQAGALARAAAW
jgi:hypothetical protein